MRSFRLLKLLILLILFNGIIVYADESVPFQLMESTPANNSTEVTTNIEIRLLFNKNVVNFSVKENNSKCIKMFDADNQEVPVELIFPDDQVEPEKKREIYVKPIEDLQGNTQYTIELSADLMAKNGNSLGENVYILFTTISTSSKEEEVPVEPLQNSSETQEQEIPAETEITEALMEDEATEEIEETQESKTSNVITSVTGSDVQNPSVEENSLTSEKESEKQEPVKTANSTEVNKEKENSNIGIIIGAAAAVIIAACMLIKFKKSRL